MKIELREITIRELVEGYKDDKENGVVAYGGKLDVRPKFQREFIYDDPQRDAVIDTVMKGHPLNVMYWAAMDDGKFEIIDGQQRTVSICKYVGTREFSVKELYYHNLQDDVQEKILNYRLMVYVCTGSASEKLEWFKTINIAGEELTAQELRNAVYSGPWVTDAKRYFSKTGCVAYKVGNQYLNGTAIRQDYLETIISWMAGSNKDEAICEYMAQHQYEQSAEEMWRHFEEVIDWAKRVFPKYYKEMKGLEWGRFYKEYKQENDLSAEVAKLMADKEVTKKSGIFEFLLSGKKKYEKLSLRAFDEDDMRTKYEEQAGVCPICKQHFEFSEMCGDHIKPWSKGGKTVPENLQMLCAHCNTIKSDKY